MRLMQFKSCPTQAYNGLLMQNPYLRFLKSCHPQSVSVGSGNFIVVTKMLSMFMAMNRGQFDIIAVIVILCMHLLRIVPDNTTTAHNAEHTCEVKMMSDLINRQDAIEALTEANLKSHMDSVEGGQENRSAIRIIMELPSAERKRGKWVDKWHTLWKEELPMCSVCNNISVFKSNYCPNCGTRMEHD